MNKDRSKYYAAAGIALITAVVYLPVLRNGFVTWDDHEYVLENPHVRQLNGETVRWAFAHFYASNWHPLTWLSHAADYAVWGPVPMGHHLTNLALHALNTFLVVLLCLRLIETAGGAETSSSAVSERKGALIAAGVTGVLFGLHPLHVESVAWVAERKDLLCGLFFLLSLTAYVSYKADRAYKSSRSYKAYGLSFAFFILALLSKPMAVSLPAVLLLFDWYPLRTVRTLRSFAASCLEKLPFLAAGLASVVVTVMAQGSGQAMKLVGPVPLWARLLVAARSLVVYLGEMAAPLRLLPYYPYPERSEVMRSLPYYLLAALFVAGVTAALIAFAKRRKEWLAAWWFYVITLLPVIGIVQVGGQAMADRYTYLPSLGPFLVAGTGAAWVWAHAGYKEKGRAARGFLAGGAAVLVLAMSYATVRQISVWKDGVSLWSYVIDSGPSRIPLAYNNRGMAFQVRGDFDRAILDYRTALSLDPSPSMAFMAESNLQWVVERKKLLARAAEEFRKEVARDPRNAKAYLKRGIAYEGAEQHDRAIEDFTMAIRLDPDYADAYTSRGLVFDGIGKLDRALQDYDTAIRLNPAGGDAYLNRGVAYAKTGEFDKALKDYGRAIELNPSDSLAYRNRGAVLERMGRDRDAAVAYSKAISLSPEDADAYIDRGSLYRKRGDRERAASDFLKACGLGSQEGCESAEEGNSAVRPPSGPQRRGEADR